MNTNETESFNQSNQNANYSELLNTVKFSLTATDDFILKSPKLYNFFYSEQAELNDTLLYEAQQQEPVISQILFCKRCKNCFSIPPLIFVQTNDC